MPEDLIFGRNAVIEALRSERTLNKLLLQEGGKGGSLGEILNLARDRGVTVEYVKAEKLNKMSEGLRHQGVAVLVSPIRFYELDEVLDIAAANGEEPFLLLLDELQDPQNVGAVIRTADAAGVHGVLLPKRRSCPINAVVAKISAGAVEHVPIVSIGNIVQTMNELKTKGLWLAGADMQGETDYFKCDLQGPIALVLGAEGKGLGRLVRENCDFLVRIPMKGGVSSLNASAAGAILLYEVLRQRSGGQL